MKRKLLCILLAVMMLLSAPFAAFASEDDTVTDGTGSSETTESGGGESGSEDGGGSEGGGALPDSGEGEDITPEIPEVTVTPVSITSISGDVTVIVGDTAKFSVEAGGDDISYLWEIKKTGSSFSSAGSTSSSYSVKIDNDSYDGAEVRCKVYNSVSSEYTSSMSITVKENEEVITVSKHPSSIEVDNGADFTLKVSANSNKGEVTYSWQYQKAGESSWRLPSESGAKTNELKMTADLSLDGAKFRCKITGVDGGEVFTDVAVITISKKIKILEQPGAEVLAQEGQPLNLVVTASGNNLSYYWYYKDKNDTDWKSTGIRSNSLTIDEVTASMKGRTYRCKVYGTDGEVYTDNIVISVLPAAPKIIKQSDVMQFVTVGDTLKLFVDAEGEDLKYEWQYMSSDSTKWISANVKKREFTEEVIDMFYNGAQFRCKVKNDSGETISNVITVTVWEAPVEMCESDKHVFTLWNVSSPATENINGLAVRTCEICGFSESRAIPAGTPADADIEAAVSGNAPVAGEEEKSGFEIDLDWTIVAIAGMVVFAAGIIILLILRRKNGGASLFDDDEDDDDIGGESQAGNVPPVTNEFVVAGGSASGEVSSDDSAEDDVPKESDGETAGDIPTEASEYTKEVTRVIPVAEINSVIAEDSPMQESDESEMNGKNEE